MRFDLIRCDLEQSKNAHIDTKSKTFVKIAVLSGGQGPNFKFNVKLSSLLAETGSFFVRNVESKIASKSTGYLDLGARKVDFKSSGIEPLSCSSTGGYQICCFETSNIFDFLAGNLKPL